MKESQSALTKWGIETGKDIQCRGNILVRFLGVLLHRAVHGRITAIAQDKLYDPNISPNSAKSMS